MMQRFRNGVVILALTLGAALPLRAQDAATLADIRQNLSVLNVEIQRLKQELNTTGAPTVAPGGGDTLDRVNAIEAALTRLTAKTEELEYRIGRVVEDGTNRIGDLEFRLVELEGGDVSQLGETSTLGGGTGATATGPAPEPASGDEDGTQLAVGEEADFRRAQEVLAEGDFRGAADLLATFGETYPGSPLEAEALLMRGQALEGAGEIKGAARAYLDSFSGHPEAAVAPQALLRLGLALEALGQRDAACQTLGQVTPRFPDAAEALEAQSALRNLGCS